MKTVPCLDRLGGARAQPFATSFLLNCFQDRKSKAGGRQIGLARVGAGGSHEWSSSRFYGGDSRITRQKRGQSSLGG